MKVLLLYFFYGLVCSHLMAQQRDIVYYQNIAHQNNPNIKQNKNLQTINALQTDLVRMQNTKVQVNFTSDIMLAPFLFNSNKIASITNTPDSKAFGYDVGLSNGALYAGQFNASKNLLGKKVIETTQQQNIALNNSLDIANQFLLHDIDKMVSDQYIGIYQIQQQILYSNQIKEKIKERKNVVEQLVKKGLMSETDFLLLRISLTNEENNEELLHTQLIRGFGQLNSLCSIQDTSVFVLQKPDVSISPTLAHFQLDQKYVTDSLNIAASLKSNNTKYLPQLNAYGNTGLYSSGLPTIYRNIGFSAGLHLVVPISDGHQKRLVTQQSKIQIDNLKITKEYSTQQIVSNLLNVLQQIKATENSIALLDKQLTSQETLLAILKEKIVLGQTSVLEYINDMQDFSTTYQSRASTEANLLLLMNQYNYLNW